MRTLVAAFLVVALAALLVVTAPAVEAARPSSIARLEAATSLGAESRESLATSVASKISSAPKRAAPKKAAPKPAPAKPSVVSSLWGRATAAAHNVATAVKTSAAKLQQKVVAAFSPATVAKTQDILAQIKSAFATLDGKPPLKNKLKKTADVVVKAVMSRYNPASARSTAWSDATYDIMKGWCALVYQPVATLQNWSCPQCKQPSFAHGDKPMAERNKSFFANTALTVTTAPTSALGKAIVVAFAGTASAGNWLTDLRAVRKTAAGLHPNIKGVVHMGFYDTIRQHMALLASVVARSKACPTCTVFITGHSLGGAVATLAAAYLVNVLPSSVHIKLYTVASPRVGDSVFANWLNSRVPDSWRAVNQEDPVPHVPYASAATTVKSAAVAVMEEAFSLFGHKDSNQNGPQQFFHVGNEAWWNGKAWKYCPMPESRSCSMSVGIDLFDASEHMIGHYPN